MCVRVHRCGRHRGHGTGDRDGGDAPGMGVMKSVDSGLTWALINAGIENLSVGSLLVNPEDPNIILAGTKPSDLSMS